MFRKYDGKKTPEALSETKEAKKASSPARGTQFNKEPVAAGRIPARPPATASPSVSPRSSTESFVTAPENAQVAGTNTPRSTSTGHALLTTTPGDSLEDAQQVSLRKAMAELRKPRPEPAKAKGALRNFRSIFKANKLPTPLIALDASEAAARENHRKTLHTKLQSGRGITDIRVSGKIGLDDEGTASLRALLEPFDPSAAPPPLRVRKKGKNRVVDLASIDLRRLEKIAGQPAFNMLFLRLSTPGAVFVYLENEEGCRIDASSTEKVRGRVVLRHEDGGKVKRNAQDLAKVSAATALALRLGRPQS